MKRFLFFLFLSMSLFSYNLSAQEYSQLESNIDSLVSPLLRTNNFSGTLLVSKNGNVLINKAYGQLNREYKLKHSLDSKFFLASVSMIFTSTAIMKLHDKGKLSVNDKVSKYFPNYKNGHLVSLHHMLAQRSGIPAIGYNGNVNYDSITKLAHTTDQLIDFFKDYDLLFPPDNKYNHGRSEYILLAKIIELVSGKTFGEFLNDEIFMPLKMYNTGHLKNKNDLIKGLATGYAPKDLYDVEPATQIDWSSKTGHASIYSTVDDLKKFGEAILNSDFLSKESKDKIFKDYGSQVGYGWFIRPHLKRIRYQMNGRSPGFSSYFAMYPEENLIITALSNNYIPLATDIGLTIAAMVLGEDFEFLNTSNVKLDMDYSNKLIGKYKFDENFYVPNFELEINYNDGYLKTQWGDLIPIEKAKKNIEDFILRTYWSTINFVKDKMGNIIEIKFDRHTGKKI